jgi:hypothetical protein
MTNDTNEVKSTPTKAFRELTEKFDLHTTRLRLIEQQFLDLAVRVNYIEDSRRK